VGFARISEARISSEIHYVRMNRCTGKNESRTLTLGVVNFEQMHLDKLAQRWSASLAENFDMVRHPLL